MKMLRSSLALLLLIVATALAPAANWHPNQVPGAADSANITNSGVNLESWRQRCSAR